MLLKCRLEAELTGGCERPVRRIREPVITGKPLFSLLIFQVVENDLSAAFNGFRDG